VRHDLLVVNQLVHRVVFTAILLWNLLFVMVVGLNFFSSVLERSFNFVSQVTVNEKIVMKYESYDGGKKQSWSVCPAGN
jgi:hypothetical protein